MKKKIWIKILKLISGVTVSALLLLLVFPISVQALEVSSNKENLELETGKILEGFTNQELDEMKEVDKKISELLSDKKFRKLSLKEKEKQMSSLLISLAEKGTEKLPYSLLQKDTIYHDEYSHNFFFIYRCGVAGCVEIVEHGDECNGSVPDTVAPKTNIKNNKTYKSGKKITFSDEGSGMKSAKLDGKKIKNGHVVKKKGKHKLVLTDKAGNKKTVKFKIK